MKTKMPLQNLGFVLIQIVILIIPLTSPLSAQSVSEKIINAITEDPNLGSSSYKVNVSSFGDEISLNGAVNNIASSKKIASIAERIAPNQRIINNIVVNPSYFMETPRKDSEIARDIQIIIDDMNLNNSSSRVLNGEVELYGDFTDFKIVDLLLSRILNVNGVKTVKSKITVNKRSYMQDFE